MAPGGHWDPFPGTLGPLRVRHPPSSPAPWGEMQVRSGWTPLRGPVPGPRLPGLSVGRSFV